MGVYGIPLLGASPLLRGLWNNPLYPVIHYNGLWDDPLIP